MGSFSIWHWLIVLLIVVLVFGTSKLKNLGRDLVSGIKGFKAGLKEGKEEANAAAKEDTKQVTAQKAEADPCDVQAKEKDTK